MAKRQNDLQANRERTQKEAEEQKARVAAATEKVLAAEQRTAGGQRAG